MADWTWFHRLGSPKWLYGTLQKWIPWLSVAAAILLITGSVWGLAFAPIDYKQGNSYRIIYVHVPASFVALAGYYVMAIAGAVNLIWRMKVADMALRAIAPIGAGMTFIALVTGAIWGKPTWGAWWVWDARVTSMLILFFLYVGVLTLHDSYRNKDAGGRACAILALVGTVNIPIIYKSVDWWYSLHQPATIKFIGKSSIDSSMLYPLIIMVIGFYTYFALAIAMQLRAEIAFRERNSRWLIDTISRL